MGILVVAEQDVGSPLRVAQCRATCLERFSNDGPNGESMCLQGPDCFMFSNDGPNGESMCLQGPDCFMCWENCELLQSNFQVWGAMCEEKEICFPGCQEACKFHAEAASQKTQPVIHTKGEGVVRVMGALARWPRPYSVDAKTPLVYVVMRKTQNGPWRQIIQTLDYTTRVPANSDAPGTMLRVLVVDPQGLVTIYSPDETAAKENKKKKKTINTEIKATTSRSTATEVDLPWELKEVSLIHQKVLVIGEIAWEPKAIKGVYLVTWEVDGGGLKGNLFTDSTCVTLSLWPDTIYHIQVELVSRIPGRENLKSEMMDLDTGLALRVSTEADDNIPPEEDTVENLNNNNSPLLSMIFDGAQRKQENLELILGGCAAVLLFAIVVVLAVWRCRSSRHGGVAIENMITGVTTVRSRKLVEDLTGYSGFQHPIIPVMTSYTTPAPLSSSTPEVAFQGAHSANNFFDKTVQV